MPNRERWDFFVSYTSPDQTWAEWIAWQVRALGFTVKFQKWDSRPGESFVAQMDEALSRSDRVLAVLSERYLASRFGREEWQAKWAAGKNLVLPVRIDDVRPSGLMAGVVYVDLFGVDPDEAKERLRLQLTDLGPPTSEPEFPGEAVEFPGNRHFAAVPDRRPFVGRDWELGALTAADRSGLVTHVVAGMGGVGKTSLVLEYSHRHRSAFRWVAWVTGGTRGVVVEQLAALAPGLGGPKADDPETAAEAVKEILETTLSQWLLVVDDVSNPAEVRGLLPQSGNGQVLLTSRHGDWSGTVADVVRLEALAESDAVRLLMDLTGSDDRIGAAGVVERVNRLALAVEQAGAAIRQRRWTFDRYIEYLDHRPEVALSDRLEGLGRTVAEVLTASVEQASNEAPHAATVLGVLSYVAADHIPRALVEGEHVVGISLLAGGDDIKIGNAIAALGRYHLITADEEALSVHRLVQQITRIAHADDTVLQDAVLTILERAQPRTRPSVDHPTPRDPAAWPAFLHLAPHILSATQLIGHRDPIGSARMLRNTGHALSAFGRMATSHAALLQAVELLNTAEVLPAAEVAATLGELGTVQEMLGDLEEAENTQRRVLAILEVLDGPDGERLLDALIKLGVVLERRGLLREAETVQARAVSIAEQDSQTPSSVLVEALTNLGEVQRVSGQLEASEATQRRALQALDSADDSYHLRITVLTHLAMTLAALDKAQEAAAIQQQSLELSEQVYGADHHVVAVGLTNLGEIERRMDRLEQSKANLERALRIKEDTYGPVHIEVALTLGHLSVTQRLIGKLEQAEQSARRALEIKRSRLQPSHQEIALSLLALGDALHELGRSDERDAAYNEAERIGIGPDQDG